MSLKEVSGKQFLSYLHVTISVTTSERTRGISNTNAMVTITFVAMTGATQRNNDHGFFEFYKGLTEASLVYEPNDMHVFCSSPFPAPSCRVTWVCVFGKPNSDKLVYHEMGLHQSVLSKRRGDLRAIPVFAAYNIHLVWKATVPLLIVL